MRLGPLLPLRCAEPLPRPPGATRAPALLRAGLFFTGAFLIGAFLTVPVLVPVFVAGGAFLVGKPKAAVTVIAAILSRWV